MARITIGGSGSRGDVQPFVALGLGLARRGHDVRLATHAVFEPLVRSAGLDFAPTAGDPQAMLNHEQGQAWLESGRNGRAFVRGFRDLAGPAVYQASAEGLAASADAELLIFGGTAFYTFYSIAEKLGLPFVQAYIQPIHPTRAFPSATVSSRWGGHALTNYLTHVLGGQAFWQAMRPIVNDIRRTQLDLPPLPYLGPFLDMIRHRLPVLYGYSPTVLPKPTDWTEAMHVTGFWFMPDASWEPPADLTAFLQAGPPPVYVGFGSMVSRDPDAMTAMIQEALAQSGQRGIILGGWAGLAGRDLPPSIMRLENAPHGWLFPRMAAVVHHGGVGTTHEGLRAGKPSVVVPFFGDQPFWGERVVALGAGPAPIPQAMLSVDRLATAIDAAVNDKAMGGRAAEIGQAIRAEEGVETAVAHIEAFLALRPAFNWRG